MQSQLSGTFRKYGHRRKPSHSNKTMPISSLLLTFPKATSNFNSISRDGTSPDRDQPPCIFHINETPVRDTAYNNTTSKLTIGKSLNEDIIDNERNECVNADDEFVFVAPCHSCESYRLTTAPQKSNDAITELCDLKCDKICAITNIANLTDIQSATIKDRHSFLSSMIKEPTPTIRVENHIIDDDTPASPIMNKQEFHEKLAVAEALARASMMTSPAAGRRLAARKVEMDLGAGVVPGYFAGAYDEYDYVPPKELLMYLVRMGSFNSAPKINNADTQDDCLDIPNGLSTVDLVQHCQLMRGENRPQLLTRNFLKPTRGLITNDIADGLRVLQLNSVSKVCSGPVSSPNHIRLLQWNILSQSLGQSNDGFICCPEEALTWECRKYLIIQEIIQNDPDVICLQEVDHFKFLQCVLGSQDYDGIFFPKPDSPCLYISQNNGPDGCAIFYKRNKFELVNYDTRILEVWRVQSNQVAITANLRILENGKEFCVCTTHLKARKGSLLSKLRNEQGKDLLRFAEEAAGDRPLLMCGDFNAEPTEPVYSTVLNNTKISLSSAYADMIASKNMACSEAAAAAASHDAGATTVSAMSVADETDQPSVSRAEILASQEPPFTTWKIREDGEVCHTIDYVFYSQDKLKVNNCLMFPKGNEIGKHRTPSFQYPSDHFSLVCDFEFIDNRDST